MQPATLRELTEHWDLLRHARRSFEEAELMSLARCALDLGHPTLACEMLEEWMSGQAASARTRYLAALAHVRIGGYRRASALVGALLADPATASSDVLALAGRIAKDRWSRLPAGPARDAAAARALGCYMQAWKTSGDIFPGINAATLLMVTGQRAAATELATEVQSRAAAAAAGADEHWRQATLGEAALLLRQPQRAAEHYAAAVAAAGNRIGHVATMRRQLRLLGDVGCVEIPPAVGAVLAGARILLFSGHMIDAPRRAEARFPPSLEGPVAALLRQRLQHLQPGSGFCSAACGGDLLFIEAMLQRGCDVHITLPFHREDFIATSVAPGGEGWVARFESAIDAATSVSYGVRERYLGDDSLFQFAADLIQGAALLKSREIEAEPLMLALLDPASREDSGGTRATFARWERLGLPGECIDLGRLRAALPADKQATGSIPDVPSLPQVELRSGEIRREVRSMLFADVVGYSRLTEEHTPSFLLNFIGAIAGLLRNSPTPPLFSNTWGDGLFLVFDEVESAAAFALQLRDAVADADWHHHGLPADTSIRIGMHTGPVFPAADPVIHRQNFFGSHVTRAARIEPVAAPGSIYISAETACLLAAGGSRKHTADFLGVLPLAKGFGSSALYRLRRSDEAE